MLFFHGLFQPLHLGQTLFPAFGGLDAFFPVKAAVTLDDGLLPLDFLLLKLVGLHAGLEVGGALLHVLGVIAGEFDHLAAQQFAHGGADVIQKIAVVADKQKGAFIIGEIVLQPLDGFQIQMVGRLVHKDDVGLLQQQLRQ